MLKVCPVFSLCFRHLDFIVSLSSPYQVYPKATCDESLSHIYIWSTEALSSVSPFCRNVCSSSLWYSICNMHCSFHNFKNFKTAIDIYCWSIIWGGQWQLSKKDKNWHCNIDTALWHNPALIPKCVHTHSFWINLSGYFIGMNLFYKILKSNVELTLWHFIALWHCTVT